MTTDVRIAARLAEEAGRLLLSVRAGGCDDSTALGRLGDTESNTLLTTRLAESRPDDAVLSEESADDPRRLEAERVWIVDPLDGTCEFSTRDRVDWAVHVALWEAGKGITAAAVSLPALDVVYSSDTAVLADRVTEGVRIVVSQSRPPSFAAGVASALGAEVVPLGSAGAKAMAVLRGDVDAYLHAGGQWEWDSAAPVGVALAAGLHASRIDGSPLRYNESNPYLPDLVICRPELAERLLAAISAENAAE
ncbi:3'(2'),5'-bisphosphate nucleotidase CysQ [Prauserella marina]|uniref:3'(2'),5-bisphosphonucleoside 3'(2')-phosphohydrolase n=1 Tax=Prauserella marina TaxID=530584 RepID=A0A222VW61_9PSEU|nr:3'(2'),5'-bisphosphate nucleotidase CysQ [Prauserella marina]ASR38144.1 3'(2'),5'-bisphosphate nucleotidase CysQ [Prauserella marina]PWV78689.1 3'-phosphoadenosine 5'-phosphosulfate (PAPS) 3'-phosphatase [Prauserella marina]SDC91580.1 3'(2'), 5'-bisphosphate nucleotidase [Prauserella marina]